MRFLLILTIPTILAFGVTTAGATPLWETGVNVEELSDLAAENWEIAIHDWDSLNRESALRRLERAAELEPTSAPLWIAFGSASLDLAESSRDDEAIRHLETASRALDHLWMLGELEPAQLSRAQALHQRVEREREAATARLVSLTDSPPSFIGLRSSMIPTPQSDPTNAPAGAAADGGSGFYGGNSDYRNGNYNVLARRAADSRAATGSPSSVSYGANALNRGGGPQPTTTGFGNPTGPPIVNERWNQNHSIRRRTD